MDKRIQAGFLIFSFFLLMVVSATTTQAAAIPAKIGVISIITGPGAATAKP